MVACSISSEEWAVHVTVKDADIGAVISEHDFPNRDGRGNEQIQYFTFQNKDIRKVVIL